MLSTLSTSLLLAVLLALPRPAAAYYCYYNGVGEYMCDNSWSYGARAGVGIAIVVVLFLILGCFLMARRRRMRNLNAGFLTNPTVNQTMPPPQPPYGPSYYGQNNNTYANAEAGYSNPPPPVYEANAKQPQDYAQYPPKVYQGEYTMPETTGQGSYAPPAGPPPNSYRQ